LRYDTFTAVSQFITELQEQNVVRRIYEDGDMMYFSLMSGERVMAYMIERAFSLQNLQHHLSTNTTRGRYSLFFFYFDVFLPAHGDLFLIEDWMRALLAVQGGLIYGFEVTGKKAFYFPVYFEGTGRYRHVTHGTDVNLSRLHGETVQTDEPSIAGRWKVASFAAREGDTYEAPYEPVAAPVSPMLRYYETLGLPLGETLTTVKKAYRDLARQYHPDVNNTPHANLRMKQINEAYLHLIAHLRGS